MAVITQGFVYVFRDRLDNNRIKVGYSTDPVARLRQLYTTATPAPLAPYCIWRVSNMRIAEHIAHVVLDDHRINKRREFFEIAPTPHFTQFEQTDYDTTSVFLDALLELIEEGMEMQSVEYMRITSLDELG